MKRTFFSGLMMSLIGLAHMQAEEQTDAAVKEIRMWYAAIEGDKSLKKQTISDGTEDEPGHVKITRYTSASGALKKVHQYSGGDHGVGNETYYFNEGKLFFVYTSSEYWRFTGKKTSSGESEVIDIASQLRLYFKDGKCIKALEKRIEITGADEIRQLLKKEPNKPREIDSEMQSYAGRAKQLAAIKTQKDLEAFLSRP